METTYRWHAGFDQLNGPWAIQVPLLPDELLSSWLIRAALIQGCDPGVLTHLIWPGWRIWTVDPDRALTGPQGEALEAATGLPGDVAGRACLEPLMQRLTALPPVQLTWPWTLALGSRNRTRRGGLQCCPQCLGADPQPYLRLDSRLAWHTICQKHQCLLLDRCPECRLPLEPHRHVAMNGGALHLCATCGFDLRHSPASAPPPLAATFQTQADEVLQCGHGLIGTATVPAGEWFAVARYFIGLLRRVAGNQAQALRTLLEALGVDCAAVPLPATGLTLETLPVHERAALLASVTPLMVAGMDRFACEAAHVGMGSAGLADRRAPPPAFVIPFLEPLRSSRRTVSGRQYTKDRPRSKQSVMRKMARLQRKARP